MLLKQIFHWYQPECNPETLTPLRRALGFYILIYYICLLPTWISLYGTPNTLIATMVWTLGFLSALCLAYGKGNKLPIVILWAFNIWIMHTNPWVINGEERILAILLIYAFFLPFYKHTHKSWILRTLQIHIASIYLFSVIWKISVEPEWINGNALYYALNGVLFTRWPGLDLDRAILKIFTWTALGLQAAFPLLLFFKKIRIYLVSSLMLLHLATGILFEGLWLFNLGMIVALTVFLIKPPEPEEEYG